MSNNTTSRVLGVFLLLVAVLPTSAQAQSAPITSRSSYAACNGSGDDAPGIQAAINQWRAVGGDLDMGSGHCMLGNTVLFGDTSNDPVFGNVYGAGPEDLVLQPLTRGYPVAKIWNMKYGEFGGMKFSGGTGDDRADADEDNTGLVIGNAVDGLGTSGVRFHNLTFEGFSVGLSVGDIWTAGAAAEDIFDNIGADGNHVGVQYAGWNSLDVVFRQLNLGNNLIGFYTDTAYGAQFYDGAGENNWTTFMFTTCCEFLVDGWREEYGANSQYWIQYGSPAAPTHLIVRGANLVDSLNPHRAFTTAIHATTPGSALIVQGSLLDGAVEGKYIDIEQTSFTNGTAVSNSPAKLRISQSCVADINTGECATDLPDQDTGLQGGGNPTPVPATATPVPATPIPTSTPQPTAAPMPTYSIRWDSVTLSNLQPNQNSLMTLSFTNTGTTPWTTSDSVTYYWTGPTTLYGDHFALPQNVSPAQSIQNWTVNALTPNTSGSYILHVDLEHGGSCCVGQEYTAPETIR